MPARGKGASYQGYKWCRASTRYAIYWRDRCHRTKNLRCVWCNSKASVDDVIKGRFRLSLDHLDPWSQGGTNHPTNLVTACLSCNARRGAESYEETCIRGLFPWHAFRRVARVREMDLDRAMGRALAAQVVYRPWRKPPVLFDRDPPAEYLPSEPYPEDDWDLESVAPF